MQSRDGLRRLWRLQLSIVLAAPTLALAAATLAGTLALFSLVRQHLRLCI